MKKVISLLLTFVLALSVCAASVSAYTAPTELTVNETYFAKIHNEKATDLYEFTLSEDSSIRISLGYLPDDYLYALELSGSNIPLVSATEKNHGEILINAYLRAGKYALKVKSDYAQELDQYELFYELLVGINSNAPSTPYKTGKTWLNGEEIWRADFASIVTSDYNPDTHTVHISDIVNIPELSMNSPTGIVNMQVYSSWADTSDPDSIRADICKIDAHSNPVWDITGYINYSNSPDEDILLTGYVEYVYSYDIDQTQITRIL